MEDDKGLIKSVYHGHKIFQQKEMKSILEKQNF